MLAKIFASVATILSAFAAVASAEDLISHESAQWRHRSDDSDLFTFVTVCYRAPIHVALMLIPRTAPGLETSKIAHFPQQQGVDCTGVYFRRTLRLY